MKSIKRLAKRCYLSLLRCRLAYATGVINRLSRQFSITYHTAHSHAFHKLSLWECQYKNELRQYLAAGQEEQKDESCN